MILMSLPRWSRLKCRCDDLRGSPTATMTLYDSEMAAEALHGSEIGNGGPNTLIPLYAHLWGF